MYYITYTSLYFYLLLTKTNMICLLIFFSRGWDMKDKKHRIPKRSRKIYLNISGAYHMLRRRPVQAVPGQTSSSLVRCPYHRSLQRWCMFLASNAVLVSGRLLVHLFHIAVRKQRQSSQLEILLSSVVCKIFCLWIANSLCCLWRITYVSIDL